MFAIWIIYHTAANYEGDKYENNNKAYATEGSIKALQDTQMYSFQINRQTCFLTDIHNIWGKTTTY